MSSSFPELPDQTTLLEHQTAGHRHEHGGLYTGMLKHKDGFVMKPVQNDERGKTEIEFYKEVMNTSIPIVSQLRDLIPRFFGLHQFVTANAVHFFIKMEDLAAGLAKPCIIDIKIGRQTWDPYSTPDKRIAENKKYCGTKEPFGFCIPGMCIYDLSSNNILKRDKFYGRTLNSETVREALLLYLNGTKVLNLPLLSSLVGGLDVIRKWFEEQRHFLFYATSLLIVYDAEELEKRTSNVNVRVRMIDFAHVYPAHGSRDSNYLEGLSNLIKILEEFRNDPSISHA